MFTLIFWTHGIIQTRTYYMHEHSIIHKIKYYTLTSSERSLPHSGRPWLIRCFFRAKMFLISVMLLAFLPCIIYMYIWCHMISGGVT